MSCCVERILWRARFLSPHNGGDRLGQVILNQGACEVWPGSKETIINGLVECWDGWIASGGMEEDG